MRVGTVVWERWRRDWYMGHVVDVDVDANAATVIETDDDDHQVDTREVDVDARDHAQPGRVRVRVRVHVHGEPETADKWYELPTRNLLELVELGESSREIGAFPQRHDCVELLVMDKALYDQLQDASARLVGRVVKVFPARDASLVDVVYPSPATAHSDGLSGVRRVSVAHGYVRTLNSTNSQKFGSRRRHAGEWLRHG
ncbi:hypothetical protein PINS_up006504 [Pythium insidiosum]|nr:hypothetical protein PINS_up006504 [Pythium insidiosum]